MTVKRFRVIKVDDMYGVSDDLAEYTVAWDKSKLIMDNLCDLLNALHEDLETEKQKNRALKTILGCTKMRLKKIIGELE